MEKMARHIRMSLLLLLACLPHGAQGQPTEDASGRPNAPLKVLFIGNSYTFYNSMPNMLSALAASSADRRQVKVKEATMGGADLDKLWGLRTTRHAISDDKWDFVVLQEHSVLPTIDPERMKVAARKMNAEIRKTGAKTILFLTWARRGKPEIQSLLDRAYFTLARELNAGVAPVGPAWRIALGLDPSIPLHAEDGSHPTPIGSYLTACVLYLVLLETGQPCPPATLDKVSPRHVATARAAALRAVALSVNEIRTIK